MRSVMRRRFARSATFVPSGALLAWFIAGCWNTAPEADADDGASDRCDSTCAGGCYDSESGLCWQEPPASWNMTWYEAVEYCTGLSLGGLPSGAWRLPTISELRSLIRGCPATETGGGCGVTDSCLDETTCRTSDCSGCAFRHGPAAGGCYWVMGMSGCEAVEWPYYWSSSSYAGSGSYAWGVAFEAGYVYGRGKTDTAYVCCVSGGP